MKIIFKEASEQLNLPDDYIEKVYKSYWKAIRETLKNIDLKKMSLEECSKSKTSINIPSIGKLYPNERIIKHVKEIQNKNEDKKD